MPDGLHDTPKCAQCGNRQDVTYVSPDMDITAVPLCVLCRCTLFYAPELNDGSDGAE